NRHAKHLQEASICIIVCARKGIEEEDEFFEQDCGAAIENILLQAEEMGYGACWCGIYPNKHRMSEVASVLSLDATPIAVITVGKSDEEPKMRGFYDESLVTVI
ncbi:MAG: nitroreductase family protein, partial [Firmicutes bacterium]|nr:nitroreductase family protein [Bacillota bacterium]